jgi:hypothetical protein
VARGHQERRRIGRSTLLVEEIRRTAEVIGTTGTQSSDQTENKPFRRPDDAEKWCEIHHTNEHDLEECKTFLNHKRMPPAAALAPQDPRQGQHRREILDGDEHMVEINMIFGGTMSITSKTIEHAASKDHVDLHHMLIAVGNLSAMLSPMGILRCRCY